MTMRVRAGNDDEGEGSGMRMGSVLLRGGFHPVDQFAGGEAVETVGDLA